MLFKQKESVTKIYIDIYNKKRVESNKYPTANTYVELFSNNKKKKKLSGQLTFDIYQNWQTSAVVGTFIA